MHTHGNKVLVISFFTCIQYTAGVAESSLLLFSVLSFSLFECKEFDADPDSESCSELESELELESVSELELEPVSVSGSELDSELGTGLESSPYAFASSDFACLFFLCPRAFFCLFFLRPYPFAEPDLDELSSSADEESLLLSDDEDKEVLELGSPSFSLLSSVFILLFFFAEGEESLLSLPESESALEPELASLASLASFLSFFLFLSSELEDEDEDDEESSLPSSDDEDEDEVSDLIVSSAASSSAAELSVSLFSDDNDDDGSGIFFLLGPFLEPARCDRLLRLFFPLVFPVAAMLLYCDMVNLFKQSRLIVYIAVCI